MEPFQQAKLKRELSDAQSISAPKLGVNMRPLPWPFSSFLTIASDCDSTAIDGHLMFATILRKRYGLPIADSYFPKWLYERGRIGDAADIDCDQFIEKNFQWLRLFYQGGFDTIHGWIPRMRIAISDDIVLREPTGFNKLLSRLGVLDVLGHSRLGRGLFHIFSVSHRAKFRTPDTWHQKESPRFFVCDVKCGLATQKLKIRYHLDGEMRRETIYHDEISCALTKTRVIVDLFETLGVGKGELDDLEIEFELLGDPSAPVEISNLCLVTDTRITIASHKRLLEKYNVRVSTYTSHGGGYDIGRITASSIEAADKRVLAELPENPHFAMDLFEEYGICFFNTANNIAVNQLRNVKDLVFMRTLNSGKVVYDFDKYLGDINEEDLKGSEIDAHHDGTTNFSFSEFIGAELRQLFELTSGDGDGAILYTHVLAKGHGNPTRRDYSAKNLLNTETHDALARLSESYFGIAPPDAANKGARIFVAPLSVLLRYSQVLPYLESNATYDSESNCLDISTWQDAVTGDNLPRLDTGFRELRHHTFYVSDSQKTRVFVDDYELDAVIRNPADATGRQSIAIADVSAPKILIGKLPLVDRTELEISQTAGLESVAEATNQWRLCAESGVIEIAFNRAGTDGYQYVDFRFQKSSTTLSYSIELEDLEGERFVISEGVESETGNAYRIIPWRELGWRRVIIPFHFLSSHYGKLFGTKDLRFVRIQLDGKLGDEFCLSHMSLLRDCEVPTPTDGCVIGGSIEGVQAIESVKLKYKSTTYQTPVTNGIFVFSEKFESGEIVEIFTDGEDGTRQYPTTGRYLEISHDTLDVAF